MTPPAVLLVAVVGLVVGSFLTVVVERVPSGRSLVVPRSSCEGCGRVLGPSELVPVVSWLVQRGRCRGCGAAIALWSPALELSTAVAWSATVLRFGVTWDGLAVAVAVSALLVQSVIDLCTHRLPRQISYVALAVVTAVLALAAIDRDDVSRTVGSFVGAVVLTAVLGALRVLSRGGMGDGDVRLAPLLGVVLGWWDPALVVVMLVVASGCGAVVGLIVMAISGAGRNTPIPFGPFLALGTIVGLWSTPVVTA